MKRFFLNVLTLILLSFCCFAFAQNAANKNTPKVELLDQTVAIVNNDVITKTQLDAQVRSIKARMQSAHVAAPPSKTLEKQVLEQMINTKVQLQFAERTGLRTSQSELNEAVMEIANRNHQTLDQLYAAVKQSGLSIADFRKEVKDELIIQKLMRRDVLPRVMINQEEIASAMQLAQGSGSAMEEYHLADILMPLPDTPSPSQIADVQKKAAEVYTKLKNGADFKQMAASVSQGDKALEGGDLGWRKLPELPEVFAVPVENLKVDGITKPIKTENGFHILKLLGKRNETSKNLVQEVKLQIIFLKKSDGLTDQVLRSQLASLRSQIHAQGDFENLAKRYSQDPKTSKTGGYTASWVVVSSYPKALQDTISSLKAGDISEPVITKEGGYLIKLVAKQSAVKGSKEQKEQVANMVFQRKLQDAGDTYVSQLRGQSYIKIFKY